MKEISTVFFDVGSTLLRPHPSVAEVCRQVFADAGHEYELATIEQYMPLVDQYYEDRYSENDAFWVSEEATSEVWVGMYSVLCDELGLHGEAPVLARRVYEEFGRPDRWALYDDVVPALDRLRARGVVIGIISNWDTRLAGVLSGLGVGGYFADVISSAAVGLRKPDPRIFELACARIGTDPECAAHVGDHHYADFYGARSAGMKAVLIDRSGAVVPDQTRIHSLDALEAALGI